MAPQNGSAKARKTGNGGGKPGKTTKSVVPAIPLPFVKRRAAAEAAAAAAAAATAAVPSSAPAKVDDEAVSKDTLDASRTEPKLTNGAAESTGQDKKAAITSSVTEKADPQPEKPSELQSAALKSTNQESPGV